MGVVAPVGADRFPRQGMLGERVEVCFDYDPSRRIGGEVIRDDVDEPYRTIIRLDDGRVVLATECQYRFVDSPQGTTYDRPARTRWSRARWFGRYAAIVALGALGAIAAWVGALLVIALLWGEG